MNNDNLLKLRDIKDHMVTNKRKFEGLETTISNFIEDYFDGKEPVSQEDFIMIGRAFHEMKLHVEQSNDLLNMYNTQLDNNILRIENLINLLSDQQNKDEAE
ncbi:hypothetical protein BFS35_002280 [Macrococcoides goetzii]|uniref:TscT toxin domain-containing protein n=1 Tax=Macrococcoides goetzii TaxID=1891097 RepID=A0A2G5NSW4_9STAP|nr:DUF1474 family protein [Macrococcus goetzii]RAI82536.1 hypothetical protein BFS35_002280 [Macrococcus goetzii]